MTGYAVVDVETTGLKNSDRIIEVAVVHLDDDLRIEGEWATLINPRRDVSARHVHGITATDVRDAPEFNDIGGHLAALLDSRIVVAHNAPFDMRMLHNEFATHPEVVMPQRIIGIDTLRMARVTLGGSASLTALCEALSIEPGRHEALGDVLATVEVLRRLLEQTDGLVPGAIAFDVPSPAELMSAHLGEPDMRWLRDEASRVAPWQGARLDAPPWAHTREQAARNRILQDSYLARLVAELPGSSELSAANLDEYVLVLEESLLDRHISRDEAERLLDVALRNGLSATEVRAAHRAFLHSLASAAWLDGVVTPAEAADIEKVAGMLDIPVVEMTAIMSVTKSVRGLSQSRGDKASTSFSLRRGDRIVFTGEASSARQELVDRAESVGLVVSSAVSKKTRAVVAADPHSESVKARKAREVGCPILAETVFLTLCDHLARAS